MNLNNQLFNLFNELIKGYKDGDNNIVEQSARCLVQLAPENPFKPETPENEEFFQMKRCYSIWASGAIDQKINRRRMVEHAKKLCALNPEQPYVYDEKAEAEEKIEQQIKTIEQQTMQTDQEDVKYVIKLINDAYSKNDDVSFQQYCIHLMDIVEANPFIIGTDEYEQFSFMVSVYKKNPDNKKKLFDAAKNLCDILNKKDVKSEKQTILGVIPEEEQEKKNWLSFILPWRKERDSNDGSRSN